MVRAKKKKSAPTAARKKGKTSARTQAAPVRLARVAKGKKPQYFADPATDKLLWMTISLMEELSVTRDRLDSVERLLDKKKLLSIRDIEKFVPDSQAGAQRDARRAAYIERVMRAVQAELEAIDPGASGGDDDPLAAVSA